LRRSFKAREYPDLNAVWLWFEFQAALIAEERGHVLRMLFKQTPAALRPHESQFLGLTRPEVDEFFDAHRAELEMLTMFELLASTEAILRIDFNIRVADRRKDSLSRRFRAIRKAVGDKIRINEHILRPMQEEGVPSGVLAYFRATLKLRHWLAHGRHWHPKLGQNYAPGDVFDIARALLDTIPLS